MDITGCQNLFGSPFQTSRQIIDRVRQEINIRCRIGIGENPLQAKIPKDILTRRWGINGEILWLNAHGIDCSPVSSGSNCLRGAGQSMILHRDYWKMEKIKPKRSAAGPAPWKEWIQW